MSDMETRLDIFTDLARNVWRISFWRYDGEIRLLQTNCPDAQLFDDLPDRSEILRQAADICAVTGRPGVVIDSMGLAWLAAPHLVHSVLINLFVTGPVITSAFSEGGMAQVLLDMQVDAEWKEKLWYCLKELPIVQLTSLLQFGLMLHFYIAEERIQTSDIQITRPPKNITDNDNQSESREWSGVGGYTFERQIMKAIETGNIASTRPENAPRVVAMSVGDHVRQKKNTMIVFVSIMTHAALRGGLPEETAYGLRDHYIQLIESEKDSSDIDRHGNEAFSDFLHRVYRHKIILGRSREIQNCLSYIESHLTSRIDFHEMADQLGYSRNYLSSKFRKEVGETMVDYITRQRIEQAMVWLRNSQMNIHEIAMTLQFNSNSYFGSVFRRLVGVSPSDYRNGRVS